jgi:hypothetical protein
MVVHGGSGGTLSMPNSYLAPSLMGMDCPEKGGKAVIALRDIPAGTLLVVWGGSVLTRVQLEALPADRRLVLQVDDDAFLLSDTEGPADWVNHSCEPNAGLRGQISLVALRLIQRGEEVCFDYAMSDGCDYDNFECHCGASRCRGMVTGHDWQLPELRERYEGYFSPYLERRFRGIDPGRAGEQWAWS